MTTATTQQTKQQIVDEFSKAQKRMLPAKLVPSTENSLKITAHLISKGHTVVTADAVYQAANELMTSLTWAVKPAKLLLLEKSAAPAAVESQVELAEQRAATVKKAELADAYAREQQEFEKAAFELIDSFLPMTRAGRVDNRKREEVQNRLKDHIAKEKARGCRMKDVHAKIAEAIQAEYCSIEREHERI